MHAFEWQSLYPAAVRTESDFVRTRPFRNSTRICSMSIALTILASNSGRVRFVFQDFAAYARFYAGINGQSANYRGRQQCQND
jgi:hypothetical protein